MSVFDPPATALLMPEVCLPSASPMPEGRSLLLHLQLRPWLRKFFTIQGLYWQVKDDPAMQDSSVAGPLLNQPWEELANFCPASLPQELEKTEEKEAVPLKPLGPEASFSLLGEALTF